MILEGEKERTKDNKKKGEEDNDDQSYPQQGKLISVDFGFECIFLAFHQVAS